MNRAQLVELAEILLDAAGDNLEKAAVALGGEALSPIEAIELAGVQAQLATAAIDLARLK